MVPLVAAVVPFRIAGGVGGSVLRYGEAAEDGSGPWPYGDGGGGP
jgi:hypothetical protein